MRLHFLTKIFILSAALSFFSFSQICIGQNLNFKSPETVEEIVLKSDLVIRIPYEHGGYRIYIRNSDSPIILPYGVYVSEAKTNNNAAVLLLRSLRETGGSDYYAIATIVNNEEENKLEFNFLLFQPQLFIMEGTSTFISSINSFETLNDVELEVGRKDSINPPSNIIYTKESWDLIKGKINARANQ